jgi:hypothetical protein
MSRRLWILGLLPALALMGPTPVTAEGVDAGAGSGALVLSGRGVYTFESSVPCPLAGFGTRGPSSCNRIALDDDHSSVTVDPVRHEIVVTNSSPYPKKEIIADLLFLGMASTKKGETTPVAIHCKLTKEGAKLEQSNVHLHPTTRDEMVDAKIDRYTVIYDDGKKRKTVMKPEDAIDSMKHPDLWSRIEGAVVSVKDNLPSDKEDPAKPGYHLADVSIGLGGAGLSHDVIRAEVTLTQPLPPGSTSLPSVMQTTEGEFKLTSLSSLLPKDALNRDLFLLGIDGLPAVQGVLKNGLAKGETFVVAVKANHAEVRVGDKVSEVPNAQEVMRDYLEFSFLGSILDKQAQGRLPNAVAPAPSK